jgi:hypothetical protein
MHHLLPQQPLASQRLTLPGSLCAAEHVIHIEQLPGQLLPHTGLGCMVQKEKLDDGI